MGRLKRKGNRRIVRKDHIESSLNDEGSCRGFSSAAEMIFEKGPWTALEDAILADYVKKHGEGNWCAISKQTGLCRSRGNCRLRWANYLSQKLKKGALTPEEWNSMIHLHSRLGKKCAQIASCQPGCSGTDIKKYWNKRAKKCQRIGLSIYLKHVHMQTSNENQRTLNFCNNGDTRGSKVLHGGMHALLDIEFDPFETNPWSPSHSPPFSDITLPYLQSLGYVGQTCIFNPEINYAEWLGEFESYLPGNHDSMACDQRMFEELPYGLDSANENLLFLSYSNPGSLIQYDGNFSTSCPLTGTVTLELPSLQYTETSYCSWPTCPPPTPYQAPYQAVDTYIQSPVAISTHFNWASPASVLLETLVQGSPAVSTEWKQSSEKRLNYSAIYPSIMTESSTANMCGAEWKGLHNLSSLFNECAPISNNFMDELSDSGGPLEMPEPTSEQMSIPNAVEKDISERLNALSTDAYFRSD